MNSYILKSLKKEKGNIPTLPTTRYPRKKKSTFIDHNEYVKVNNEENIKDIKNNNSNTI